MTLSSSSSEEIDDDVVAAPTPPDDDEEALAPTQPASGEEAEADLTAAAADDALMEEEEDKEERKDDSSFAASGDDGESKDDESEEESEDDFVSDEEEEEKKKEKKRTTTKKVSTTTTAKAKVVSSATAATAAASSARPGLPRRLGTSRASSSRVLTAPVLGNKMASTTAAAPLDKKETNSGDSHDLEEEEEEDSEPEPVLSQQDAERRAANVAALLGGSLAVARRPIAQSLSVAGAEAVLRSAFCSPLPGAPAASETLKRKLLKRRVFVPWGSNQPLPMFKPVAPVVPLAPPPTVGDKDDAGPPPGEPLCLWEEPEESFNAAVAAAAAASAAPASDGNEGAPAPPPPPRARVAVDPMLTRWLRPHQREGVAFMFECVTGIKGFEGRGCLLADDMGLGKTLQALTLLWTMLNSGHALLGGSPLARRAVICCPTSLVGNWEAEARKFLRGRLRVLALCECSREEAAQSLTRFLSPVGEQVLIVSYETFRIHAPKFDKPGSCDLLICDEAHRLKNAETLTSRAIGALPCRARVLLSGTPLQNRLDEFYAMVDFANPGVLGSIAEFRKRFEAPILAGREPGASTEESSLGAERAAALSGIVNDFILRRTNALLSAHLPPKIVEVICCRLSPLQRTLYDQFLGSVAGAKSLIKEPGATGGSSRGTAKVLSAITSLRKLCNHPKLIWDAIQARRAAGSASSSAGMPDAFEGCERLFPEEFFGGGAGSGAGGKRGRGGGLASILGRGSVGPPPGWEALSGKFDLAAALLAALHARGGGKTGSGGDRIVIVSNATQTLDLFVTLCRQRNYPFLRLDGSTSISKRTKLVTQFNDPNRREFVFLLSSKAGGCGLNLVGANRLMLFDPAWNPADDKQAAARVWRDGQKRRVYVYRLLATGSLDEKIWQRQCSKEGLKCVVDGAAGTGDANGGGDDAAGGGGGGGGNEDNNNDDDSVPDAALMSTEELRDLFTLRADVASDTLEAIEASEDRGKGNGGGGGDNSGSDGDEKKDDNSTSSSPPTSHDRPQAEGKVAEEDIAKYARHSRVFDVDDDAMKEAAATCPGVISFVFSLKVDGKALDDEGGGASAVSAGVGGVPKAVPPASAPTPSAAASALPSSAAGVPLRGSGALGMRSRLGLGLAGARPAAATMAATRAALGVATTNIASAANRAFTAPVQATTATAAPRLSLPAAKRAKAGICGAAVVASSPAAAGGAGRGRGRGGRGGAAVSEAGGRGRGRGGAAGARCAAKGRRKAESSDEEMSEDDEEDSEEEEDESEEDDEEEESGSSGSEDDEEASASEGEEKEKENEAMEEEDDDDAPPDPAAAAVVAPKEKKETSAAAPPPARKSSAAATAKAAPAVARSPAVVAAGGNGASRQSLSSKELNNDRNGVGEDSGSGRAIPGGPPGSAGRRRSMYSLYADDDDDFM